MPHPDNPTADYTLDVTLTRVGKSVLLLDYVVTGAIDRLVVPAPKIGARTDGLWRTTCFELFLRPGDGNGYFEYNLSPSGQWAIYRFEDYRAGMVPVEECAVVRSWTAQTSGQLLHTALIEVEHDFDKGRAMLGASAVIEHGDGAKAYWALRHPPGNADFHHPDCFALALGAPQSA